MNANANLDALVGREAGVALSDPDLHLHGGSHSLHHAAELDDRSIACALDETPIVDCDGGVDEIAAQRPQPGQRALFIRARHPAVAHNVRD
jgi:hypothetical protein